MNFSLLHFILFQFYCISDLAKSFAFAISEINQIEASSHIDILVMTVFSFLDYIKSYNLIRQLFENFIKISEISRK